MAEELITYGMIRAKGYTVSATKGDSEYAIKEDFQVGGAVGFIPTASIGEYGSNELIKNSSIPLNPPSMIINFTGVSYDYSYALTIGLGSLPANDFSIPMLYIQNGVNTFDIPMTVYDIGTGKSKKVSSGSVSIYRKAFGGNWEFRSSFSVINRSNISVSV